MKIKVYLNYLKVTVVELASYFLAGFYLCRGIFHLLKIYFAIIFSVSQDYKFYTIWESFIFSSNLKDKPMYDKLMHIPYDDT